MVGKYDDVKSGRGCYESVIFLFPVVRVGSEEAVRLTAWNEVRRPRGTREVVCG